MTGCSQAAKIATGKSPRDNTPVWFKTGSLQSDCRASYATHSMRRTKANLIYRKTGNLRVVQLLLGHTKIDRTVRYLGVEVEDALALAEGIDL